MASTVTVTVTNPAPDYCPDGPLPFNIINWVKNHITATFNPDAGTGIQIIRQAATPAPVPSVIWSRIGSTGGVSDPQGQYVYFNGRWVPDPTGLRIGDLMMTNFDPNGYMNTDGKGLFVPVSPATDTPNIAGPLFGWQLANGNNGSVNLQNRYPRAGYKYIEGTGWVANTLQADGTYADITNGGREGITLTAPELPPIPTRTFSSTVATAATPALLSGLNYDNTVAAGVVNTSGVTQVAIQPINPLYRTVGIYSWIGYFSASQT